MKDIDIEVNKIRRKYDLLWRKIDIYSLVCSLSKSSKISFDLEKIESRIMTYLPHCMIGKLQMPQVINGIAYNKLPHIMLLCWNIISIHVDILPRLKSWDSPIT